jgi:hypothetical protein
MIRQHTSDLTSSPRRRGSVQVDLMPSEAWMDPGLRRDDVVETAAPLVARRVAAIWESI